MGAVEKMCGTCAPASGAAGLYTSAVSGMFFSVELNHVMPVSRNGPVP